MDNGEHHHAIKEYSHAAATAFSGRKHDIGLRCESAQNGIAFACCHEALSHAQDMMDFLEAT